MSELGEKVFNEVNEWWANTSIQQNYSVINLIKKTIELMEESFNNQYADKVDERVEEIAMQRAKDINGIPVRTLIAKDIVTTMIGGGLKAELENADVARIAVDMTDELLKALKK